MLFWCLILTRIKKSALNYDHLNERNIWKVAEISTPVGRSGARINWSPDGTGSVYLHWQSFTHAASDERMLPYLTYR